MRCKQFIIVSLAGVVLAASLAGCLSLIHISEPTRRS